jgi:hypothetical protein
MLNYFAKGRGRSPTVIMIGAALSLAIAAIAYLFIGDSERRWFLGLTAAPVACLVLYQITMMAWRRWRDRRLKALIVEGGPQRNHLFRTFPPQLDREFHEHYNENNTSVAWGAMVLGEFLYLAFYLWDLVVDYDQAPKPLFVRRSVGALIMMLLLTPRRIRVNYLQELYSTILR